MVGFSERWFDPERPWNSYNRFFYLFWGDLECLNGFLISNEYLNNELFSELTLNMAHMTH